MILHIITINLYILVCSIQWSKVKYISWKDEILIRNNNTDLCTKMVHTTLNIHTNYPVGWRELRNSLPLELKINPRTHMNTFFLNTEKISLRGTYIIISDCGTNHSTITWSNLKLRLIFYSTFTAHDVSVNLYTIKHDWNITPHRTKIRL